MIAGVVLVGLCVTFVSSVGAWLALVVVDTAQERARRRRRDLRVVNGGRR
jgi:hypothetical protein